MPTILFATSNNYIDVTTIIFTEKVNECPVNPNNYCIIIITILELAKHRVNSELYGPSVHDRNYHYYLHE